MAGYLEALMNPATLGLLNASAGLLQAGGPSRVPVGFGQALGQGVQQGAGAFQTAQQQQAMLNMHNLQAGMLAQNLKKAEQTQGALAEFAKSLPPEQQAAFLASPETFIKERFAPYTLKPGESRFVGDQAVTSLPQTPTLQNLPVPGQPGVEQPTWLTPGQASGVPVGGMKMPEILNPQVQAARVAVATAGKPDVNVRVNTELGKGLAGEVKDIVGGTRAAAAGASDTIETVGRMRDALDTKKINVGPGATVRNTVDQVAVSLGVGGSDTAERLINTRTLIRGLAQSTIAARQQLKGQGAVSDFEGKLLERANSGNIDDFTIPELKSFMEVTERIARKAHSEHNRMLDVMRNSKDESVRGLVPYFEVPPINTEKGPTIIRYDATGKRL